MVFGKVFFFSVLVYLCPLFLSRDDFKFIFTKTDFFFSQYDVRNDQAILAC
jgi:hypothetical protein